MLYLCVYYDLYGVNVGQYKWSMIYQILPLTETTKFQTKSLSKDKMLQIRNTIDELSNTTQTKILRALAVTNDVTNRKSTSDILIRSGLANVQRNKPQFNTIRNYGKDSQKNYVISKNLKLYSDALT